MASLWPWEKSLLDALGPVDTNGPSFPDPELDLEDPDDDEEVL
jgi:hypothetical protein